MPGQHESGQSQGISVGWWLWEHPSPQGSGRRPSMVFLRKPPPHSSWLAQEKPHPPFGEIPWLVKPWWAAQSRSEATSQELPDFGVNKVVGKSRDVPSTLASLTNSGECQSRVACSLRHGPSHPLLTLNRGQQRNPSQSAIHPSAGLARLAD